MACKNELMKNGIIIISKWYLTREKSFEINNINILLYSYTIFHEINFIEDRLEIINSSLILIGALIFLFSSYLADLL